MEHLSRLSSTKGPDEWFSGDVWIDAIAAGFIAVHFTPGARTVRHSHSKPTRRRVAPAASTSGSRGQTLYVNAGRGLVQSRGQQVVEIRAGDVVRTRADEWHWHGADHDHTMSHISLAEAGSPTWGERVSDAEYCRPPE